MRTTVRTITNSHADAKKARTKDAHLLFANNKSGTRHTSQVTWSCPAFALLMSRAIALRNTADISAERDRMPMRRPSLNMVASQ